MSKITEKRGKLLILLNKRNKFYAQFLEDGNSTPMPISWYSPKNSDQNERRCLWITVDGKHSLSDENGNLLFSNVTNTSQKMTNDSYSPQHTMIPLFSVNKLPENGIDNFQLKLNKAARYDQRDKKFKHHSTEINVSGGVQPYSIRSDFGKFNNAAIRHISERLEHHARSIGIEINAFNASSPKNGFQRMIVGLGNESVYENGITLHHVLGIPYIPGSAIKGVTRSWIVRQCFQSSEEEALRDKLFCFLFGTGNDSNDPSNRGSAYFFDAFPTKIPEVRPDVMNNHFQSYYEGKTPPGDWISPNPIFFLSVSAADFRFVVGIRMDPMRDEVVSHDHFAKENATPSPLNYYLALDTSEPLISLLSSWVMNALKNHGIGAKTAVGYGRLH